MTEPSGERIQKVLARAGLGSRRTCDELVRTGRVKVNGRVAELGARVDPSRDRIDVDDVEVALAPGLVYMALHKPLGVVTTARDTHGRTTVLDLVPGHPQVHPVGRLDRDTSGLLLLTNDGAFANRVAHPRYGVPKTYVAEVRGKPDRSVLRRLTRGVELDDGVARAQTAEVRASSPTRAVVELVVREGRNRLVRRMLGAVGLEVTSLVRTAVGPVRLGRLKEGDWRNLKRTEVLDVLKSTTA